LAKTNTSTTQNLNGKYSNVYKDISNGEWTNKIDTSRPFSLHHTIVFYARWTLVSPTHPMGTTHDGRTQKKKLGGQRCAKWGKISYSSKSACIAKFDRTPVGGLEHVTSQM
jgi:hypothetical protein